MDTEKASATAVYLELGARRVFACARDWPGWCRSGKDEEQALTALTASATRYATVAAAAGVAFPARTADAFDVIERLAGSATTDFGAPGAVAASDAKPLTPEDAERLASLLAASWTVFDHVVAGAPPVLRKGPRGGGRDRNAVVEHVLGAETAYARKLGIRHRQPARGDATAVSALRTAIVAMLRTAAEQTPPVKNGWPPRFAARRIAWHVLDHAWEMEDRSGQPP